MSSPPPTTPEPTPPAPPAVLGPVVPIAPPAPLETAPSAILTQVPMLTRAVGVAGLFLTVLGVVVVVTTRAIGTPRIVPESWGFIFAGFGLVLLLYHAVTDTEQEIRRMYGLLAAVLLVLALASGLLPGPFDGTGGKKETGYYLLPWGIVFGLLALLFALPFVRNETDEGLRDFALYALLGVGALLCVGSVLAGISDPDFLAGSGVLLALLGLAFVCGYLGQVDTSEGLGYLVAFAVGALGALVAFYAFARTVFPTVLFEGSKALRDDHQALDRWKIAGRALVVLVFLGVAALGVRGKYPAWLRAVLVAFGLGAAGVFVAGSIGTQINTPPRAFLVPGGLILGVLGLIFLGVGLGVCSDNQLVTLTRRELSAYFFSPIGYMVLGGMALCQGFGYAMFWDYLMSLATGLRPQALPEPIVREYLFDLIPILCVILPIPALTMRLLAEEKERGSLEVLLTAPVNEWPVVLSKFLATWIFFLICWLPAGLFMIGVRAEGGEFDYRPLLSFYASLAACSAAFVACGVFFSALTRNQLVAAVLTFLTMLFFVVCAYSRGMTILGPTLQAFMAKLSFMTMWRESLRGQLPVRDVLVWASAAVFGLFLSVKVLEARKWN